MLDRPPRGGQQLLVGMQRPHVLNRRRAEPVAVTHADRVHASLIKLARDQLDLSGRVAVLDAVRSVAQSRVKQPDLRGVGWLVHRARPFANRSATRTAADVMMSRFPAYCGR